MKLRLPFLALSLLLVLNACVRENSAPSEPATFEPGEGAVFLTSVPFEDAMTVEDFPNSERDGSGEAAVVWQDRLLVRSTSHIFEYDWDGNLLAYSDSALVPMARDMALIGDSLFVASWEEGIYEVDLTSNRVVNFYDAEDGLMNVQNLRFAVDAETLWVGTFQGVARIDTTTDEVHFYADELNVEGSAFSAAVYANGGDIWAEVYGNSYSEGGVSRYDSKTDTWTAYGPTAFMGDRWSAQRVDFLSFIVSDEGVFAAFQENGPAHEVLQKFDPAQDTWNTVFESSAETFMSILPSKLPARETYSSSYYDDIAQTVSIFDGGTWKTISAPMKTYASIVHEGDAYYLLSSSGIEQFSKGNSFPEVIGASDLMFGFNPPAFFITEDDRYLTFFVPKMNEMAGSWAYVDAGAYDFQTSNFFSTRLDLSALSHEELPASEFVFPDGQTQFPFGTHQMVLDLNAHTLTLQ